MKNIITLPSPILRKKSVEADPQDKKTQALISEMVKSLQNEEIGVGLSAPQIGENKRIFVIEAAEIRDNDGGVVQKAIPLMICVNPIIIKTSQEKRIEEEGCLSYPSYYAPVERALKLKMECLDEGGTLRKINASGMLARIIQHEFDHLEGILFIDRVADPKTIKKYPVRDDKEL